MADFCNKIGAFRTSRNVRPDLECASAQTSAKPCTRINYEAQFVSRWEGELDHHKLQAGLSKEIDPTDVETAITTG